MALPDLLGPYDDLLRRTFQIRAVLAVTEAMVKSPTVITTSRKVDLTKVGAETTNTVTAMSLVFLASSFEEFVREEITQCSGYMSERYPKLTDQTKHGVRNAYWNVSLDRLRLNRSILTKTTPKLPDMAVVTKVRKLVDSIQGFVINDNSSLLENSVFCHHANNFRPHVVDEIANRLGITGLLGKAADSGKLRAYFGVTTKAAAAEKLNSKLTEFYDRRNEIVHSLSGSAGYAVDVILDYADLIEATAESIRNVLSRELTAW